MVDSYVDFAGWQVLTEHVRLTDDGALREQTEENGDLFLWLRHQATQGVVSAQVGMAVC